MKSKSPHIKRILVPGCAGFIGSKVAELLLKQGYEVLGLDNLNNYYNLNLKKWRLATLRSFPLFSFNKKDITKHADLCKIFAQFAPQAVINLAARAGIRASIENPWYYLEANLKGTLNLLECCREFKVKKFVMASTSSLYALNRTPFAESDDSSRPLSPYGATKKGAEALAYTYYHLYGIDVAIPRYFTVYGPAGRPDMSVYAFSEALLQGRTIRVFGNGQQKRDFTYVDDIAEGTVKALDLAGYHIFNLGNDNPIKIIRLIRLLEKYFGQKARIDFLPGHPADVPATWADISLSKDLLRWQPKVSIEEGLKRTVDWFKGEYKNVGQ